MAQILNISNKLNNEAKFIVFGEDKKYKVNDNYKTLMRASELFNGENVNEADAMMEAIELIIGRNARREVEEMSLENVKVVFTAVMAIVQGQKFEDMETRFQE